ncbi:hypothetical protein VTK26DRAFT_7652 [Humicola hyalothermophila]
MTPTMDRTLHPIRHRHAPAQGLRHITKITACGGMIGTAILFPLAYNEGLWFRAVTLSIFILTTLGFHVLHINPFVRFGPFTATVALILLVVAVLSGGSTRSEIIPWLPVFIASLSLATVAIHELSQCTAARPLSYTTEDEFSGVAVDAWSERSLLTLPTSQGHRAPSQSNRFDPPFYAHQGPSSRCSHRTDAGATEITLSGVVGQCREHWDAQTRKYFDRDTSLVPDVHAEAQVTGDRGHENTPERDSDSDSEHGNEELTRPLLFPH